MSMEHRRNDIALIVLFSTLLAAPFVSGTLGITLGVKSTENRKLRTAPALTWANRYTFAPDYEAYFNDNFGLRNALVKENNRFRLVVAGISANPSVVVGREDWLFYNAKAKNDGAGFEEAQGLNPYTQERLEEIRLNLERRDAEFRRRGIVLIQAVCPDKHTVYPEFLPSQLPLKPGVSRTDQVIDYMKAHSRVRILDLREALIREKARGPLYFKTDTHWNSAGAYVAYLGILRRLQKDFPGLTVPDSGFSVKLKDHGAGDLASMLLAGSLFRDQDAVVEPAGMPAGHIARKILVHHDSFFNALKPRFRHHFGSVVSAPELAAGGEVDMKLIDKEKPDVVLISTVERYWITK